MDENLREVIIANLANKYGKPFVKPADDGIVVRQTGRKRGGAIYHIPANLLPSHDTDEFVDPIAGYQIPAFIHLIYPRLLFIADGPSSVSFVSHYSTEYDNVNRGTAAHITLCAPDEAKYLLISFPAAHNSSPPSDYLAQYKDNLLWTSRRIHGPRNCEHYTDLLLIKMGVRIDQTEQTIDEIIHYAEQFRAIAAACVAGQTPPDLIPYTTTEQLPLEAATSQCAEINPLQAESEPPLKDGDEYDYGYGTSVMDGKLQYHSFNFMDDISGEQSWVITARGYLLRPNKVIDHSNIIYADIAEFEIWQNLPTDCLIIHWQREGIDQPHQPEVVYRPLHPAAQQIRRVRDIETKIYQSWKDRRDPATGRLIDNAHFTWNIAEGE